MLNLEVALNINKEISQFLAIFNKIWRLFTTINNNAAYKHNKWTTRRMYICIFASFVLAFVMI